MTTFLLNSDKSPVSERLTAQAITGLDNTAVRLQNQSRNVGQLVQVIKTAESAGSSTNQSE